MPRTTPDARRGHCPALLSGLLALAWPAQAVDVVVGTGDAGTTPPLLGYNFAHYLEGGNARDLWRHAGVRHVRVFLPSSLAEPNDDLAPHGDGVTSAATFASRRAAVRANPLDTTLINWPYLLDRYANSVATGNNRYRVNHAFGELRAAGTDILVQLTASLAAFPITGESDWAGRWELWQHYYFQAFYLAREFDVRRWSMFNEPNHPNANGITPTQWLERLRLASDAIQCAIADVNRLHGKSLVPLVHAPTTAGATGEALTDWGLPAIQGRRLRHDGVTDPTWSNVHVYSYQSYSASASSFSSNLATVRAAVDPAWSATPRVPIALTEWNVSTGANFDEIPDSMDTPLQAARLGANAVALTIAGADHLYLFKFGMTATTTGSNYPVQKNGMHHVDNSTGASVNRYGAATLGAEAWRLFVRAAGPEGSRRRFPLSIGPGADSVSGIAALDPARDRIHVFLANVGSSSVSIRLDLSGHGIAHDTRAVIAEASSRNYGAVAAYTRVNDGFVGPFTLPAQASWMVTIPRQAQQPAPSGTPTFAIPASAAVTLRDGAARTSVTPPAPLLAVRHDPASADGRAAALLRFPLPRLHPDDLEFAVLTLQASTATATAVVQSQVYVVDDDGWSPANATWATTRNLRQLAATGNRIRDSLLEGQGETAHLAGQLHVDGPALAERSVDVTDLARTRLGGDLGVLVLQEPRWDVTLPGLASGDTQVDGLRIASPAHPDAATIGPRLRLVRRLDSDGDGLGDATETRLGLDPARVDSDADGVADGEELLVLATDPLSPGSGPRAAWAATLAAGDAALAARLALPLGDEDRDGLPHLLEYALGLDPTRADPRAMEVVGEAAGRLAVTFPRRVPATDVVLSVEFSADLDTWAPGTITGAVADGPGRERATATAPGTGERFARVRVATLSP